MFLIKYNIKIGDNILNDVDTLALQDADTDEQWDMFNTVLGYSVIFQHNSTEYLQISVPSGSSVDKPKNPTVATGYSFVGWYTAINGGGTRVTFPYTPTQNITLYSYSVPETFITFSSDEYFSVGIVDNTKYANGTLEYSTNKTTWTSWNCHNSIASVKDGNEYFVYLRGTGNTTITGNTGIDQSHFVLNGNYVACSGNIENLLDYATVQNNQHPTMDSYCYSRLFYDCRGLTSAPSLPATTLKSYCYQSMFENCYCLKEAPTLPSTSLATYCYYMMFKNCFSLLETPTLGATSLTDHCYHEMFYGCYSLKITTTLPATTVPTYAYASMFYNCTSVVNAPALPATTLNTYCYYQMFMGCTKLSACPTLSATTMMTYCYSGMFRACTSITTPPVLPATTLASYCYYNMFYGCTKLTTVPKLSVTTLQTYCYRAMFYGCTSLTALPELPATTLKNYCYYQMFQGCTLIKLSTTQDTTYTTAYRIPSSGTGTTGTNSIANMFTSTGGTFTGAPTLDTTYYTSNTVVSAT